MDICTDPRLREPDSVKSVSVECELNAGYANAPPFFCASLPEYCPKWRGNVAYSHIVVTGNVRLNLTSIEFLEHLPDFCKLANRSRRLTAKARRWDNINMKVLAFRASTHYPNITAGIQQPDNAQPTPCRKRPAWVVLGGSAQLPTHRQGSALESSSEGNFAVIVSLPI